MKLILGGLDPDLLCPLTFEPLWASEKPRAPFVQGKPSRPHLEGSFVKQNPPPGLRRFPADRVLAVSKFAQLRLPLGH